MLLKVLLILFILYCLAALFWGPPVCHEPYPFSFRPPGFEGCARPVEPLAEIPAPAFTPDQDEALKAALDEEAHLQAEYEKRRSELEKLAETCRPESELPKSGDRMTIPDEAREKNDFKFLEGCWVCDSGLFNSRTKKPIVMEFCFDAQGRGEEIIEDPDHGTCRGMAQASFADETLEMNIEDAPCSNKKDLYAAGRIQCVGKNGEAHCMWQSTDKNDPSRWEQEAVFRRK